VLLLLLLLGRHWPLLLQVQQHPCPWHQRHLLLRVLLRALLLLVAQAAWAAAPGPVRHNSSQQQANTPPLSWRLVGKHMQRSLRCKPYLCNMLWLHTPST
jgi:hypothetical protein